jgi:hypothetical protein
MLAFMDSVAFWIWPMTVSSLAGALADAADREPAG